MAKFKEMFSEAVLFSDGAYYIDADIPKKDFIEQLDPEIKIEHIEESRIRFGFAPDCREEFGNKPVWYSGASGKGSKKVWVYQPRKHTTTMK